MALNLESIIGGSIGDIFGKVVGAFKADPTVALQVQAELAKAQIELQSKLIDQISSQIDVDKAEAQNTNWFVAGWRPFVGWICGLGIGIQFIAAPIADWVSALMGHAVTVPALDLGTLMTLLFGMLGIGGMRTFEKLKGVQSAH